MPTGYTAKIEKGTETFRGYAIRCMKAFGGGLIDREQPVDDIVRWHNEDQEMIEYYKKELDYTRNELQDLKKKSDTELMWAIKAADDQKKKEWDKYHEEDRKIIEYYYNILSKVKKFVPPTEDHEEYKRFMISQIEECLQRKESSLGYYPPPVLRGTTIHEYRQDKIKSLESSIEGYIEKIKFYEDKPDDGNKWIQDILDEIDRVEGLDAS